MLATRMEFKIDKNEAYEALFQKIDALEREASIRVNANPQELDRQLLAMEYALMQAYGNNQFNKQPFLESSLQTTQYLQHGT